jgi:peroxiredoxin Q/BCP
MSNPKVAVGQPAPVLVLPADDGTTVDLAQLRGKTVVVYFYPKDDTPGCTKEACDFRDRMDTLTARGAVVLGVSPDSVDRHKKFIAKYDLNFRLLADTANEVADAWGVWRLKKNYGREYMGIVRSTFLIDGDGVVQQVWDNVRVRRKLKGEEVRHVTDVEAAIDALA